MSTANTFGLGADMIASVVRYMEACKPRMQDHTPLSARDLVEQMGGAAGVRQALAASGTTIRRECVVLMTAGQIREKYMIPLPPGAEIIRPDTLSAAEWLNALQPLLRCGYLVRIARGRYARSAQTKAPIIIQGLPIWRRDT